MANNCYFEITLHGDRNACMRVFDVIEHKDSEYWVAGSWGADIYEDDGECVKLFGDCPWSDARMWAPTDSGYTLGEEDEQERKLTSIPDMCRMWGLTATGFAEECGCEVGNRWSCDSNGNVEYQYIWPEIVLDYLESGNLEYLPDVRKYVTQGEYDEETRARLTARFGI